MIFCIRIKLRMNIHQVLFFCFLSDLHSLQDGNTGFTNAVDIYVGAEGVNGSLSIIFTSSGNTKFLCKGECKEENILIKTDRVKAQSGRYSIRSETRSTGRKVTVYFTQLTKSDSGRYRIGLGRSLVPDDYSDVDVIVTDEATLGDSSSFIRAGTEGGSVTVGCSAAVYGNRTFFCKGECKKKEDILVETEENRALSGRYSIEYREGSAYGLYVTITQLNKSDTGRYKCGYRRPSTQDLFYGFPLFVIDAPTSSFPETTEQFAAPTTEEPTSVPSASTLATTQSLTSSSGSFTPSSSFPDTTEQFAANYGVFRPGYFWPLVVCVPVIVVLAAVVLLFVYKLKMRRNFGLNTRETSDSRNKELSVHYKYRPPVHYENRPPVHYENRPPVHYENRPPVHYENRPPVHYENRPLAP